MSVVQVGLSGYGYRKTGACFIADDRRVCGWERLGYGKAALNAGIGTGISNMYTISAVSQAGKYTRAVAGYGIAQMIHQAIQGCDQVGLSGNRCRKAGAGITADRHRAAYRPYRFARRETDRKDRAGTSIGHFYQIGPIGKIVKDTGGITRAHGISQVVK